MVILFFFLDRNYIGIFLDIKSANKYIIDNEIDYNGKFIFGLCPLNLSENSEDSIISHDKFISFLIERGYYNK